MIHPTVVTHPKAKLDSDVTVGPYALVEGPIVIGRGTEIQGHALISGSVRTGKNNRVGGAVIGSFPQDLSFDPKASSLLQGNSRVEKDIPPFSIPIGKDSIAALNVIGLRRAGFGPAFRKEMKNGIWFLGFYSSFASSETKPGKFFEDCFPVASG